MSADRARLARPHQTRLPGAEQPLIGRTPPGPTILASFTPAELVELAGLVEAPGLRVAVGRRRAWADRLRRSAALAECRHAERAGRRRPGVNGYLTDTEAAGL